jgi:hypothetical protein
MTTPTAPDENRRQSTRRHPGTGSIPRSRAADSEYWEEVALARLRLAQLALVVTLAGSVVIALILG